MKKIQKLTLSLLTVAAVSTWNTTFAAVNLQSDSPDVAEVDAPLTGAFKKVNDGTIHLSGNNAGMTNLEINNGLIQASNASALGAAIDFTGGNLEVLASSDVLLPAVTMTAAAVMTSDANAISRIDNASGAGAMTLAGVGTHIAAGNLSACTSDVNVGLGTDSPVYQVGGASTATPAGTTTVLGGAVLELVDVAASSVTGVTEVQDGGTVLVDASLNVPATGTSDIFANTLKFNANSTLILGNGARWSRPIEVDVAG